ncbi:ABC-type Fe3+ transport system permease subunit [Deinococcus sp. HSC-46F16]|uniref:hypothetical protein n=1 Tax=Deinococcus sp. HSC-46F16 TaxID=2910968 RepID=UPI0020A0D0A4|nr:hypothetical protein [Deinococcus sp. HSC-46F16]MCP2013485.1 ABC-type Fe3+ transport system permease subunit [Deinococcus sp. HSC-46F16]
MMARQAGNGSGKSGTGRRVLGWLAVLGLTLLTLGGAALTLGAFANLNPAAPLWLRTLGSVESLLSGSVGLGDVPGFWRAVGLSVVTSVLAALIALARPR